MTVEELKADLENYAELKEQYEILCNNSIRSFTFDNSGSTSKSNDDSFFIRKISKKDKIKKETERIESMIFLITGKEFTALYLKYIKCLKMNEIENEMQYSKKQIYRYINTGIKKIVDIINSDPTDSYKE